MPEKYDWYYLNLALAVRKRAKCHGRTVGAVLVREDRVIATGFNGTPSGMTNCTEGGCERCQHPDRYPPGTGYDRCICVHAEQNALLMSARFGIAADGAMIFTTMRPCFSCLKELVQAGVKRVVYGDEWSGAAMTEQYQQLAKMVEMEQQPIGGAQ